MLVYWFNILSIPIWYSLIINSKLKKTKQTNLLLVIIFFQWLIIASLRHLNVGWDTPTYADYFESISSYGVSLSFIAFRLEPFYILLNYAVGFLSKSPHFLYFVVAFLIYSLILRRMPRYSFIPWLSCFLFIAFGFYNFSINILRQSISIAIIIFSLKYIVDRKSLAFLICVLIATLFHYTSIVFIITYPLFNLPINLKSYIIIIIASLLASYLILPRIMRFVISANPYYEMHLSGNGSSGFGMLSMIILTTLCSLILFKGKPIDGYGRLWFIMLFIATGMQFASLKISILVRLVYFWQISMIFIFPYIIHFQQNRNNKIFILIFTVLISLIYYSNYAINVNDVNGTVPYKTFL